MSGDNAVRFSIGSLIYVLTDYVGVIPEIFITYETHAILITDLIVMYTWLLWRYI